MALLRSLPQPIRELWPACSCSNQKQPSSSPHPPPSLSPEKEKSLHWPTSFLRRNSVVPYCTGRQDPARDRRRNRLHWPAGFRKDSKRRNH
ncbi:hypothetical protein NPIL_545591 [Nephila pilipes]|uniref:Uncharacterized protein n=1 Tax=Nephila pilipes TaxID=299642 RepID=A0A8X6N234_NEPPI|nr:hypothetical protein NPIL_545591 [Nephila pilipes]